MNDDERSLRQRRSIVPGEFTETEHLFVGWAIMVSNFESRRMVHTEAEIGRLVREAELEELEENLKKEAACKDSMELKEKSFKDEAYAYNHREYEPPVYNPKVKAPADIPPDFKPPEFIPPEGKPPALKPPRVKPPGVKPPAVKPPEDIASKVLSENVPIPVTPLTFDEIYPARIAMEEKLKMNQ